MKHLIELTGAPLNVILKESAKEIEVKLWDVIEAITPL